MVLPFVYSTIGQSSSIITLKPMWEKGISSSYDNELCTRPLPFVCSEKINRFAFLQYLHVSSASCLFPAPTSYKQPDRMFEKFLLLLFFRCWFSSVPTENILTGKLFTVSDVCRRILMRARAFRQKAPGLPRTERRSEKLREGEE